MEFKTNFKESKRVRRYESNFSDSDKSYFDYNYACWECGMNRFK